MNDMPILSLIIFLPLLGALGIAFLPSSKPSLIRFAALGVSLITFVLSLGMLAGIRGQSGEFAFSEQLSWIPSFGITYHLGVDGLSGALVVLTTLLSWICILASFGPIQTRVKEYFISFLILETGMLGVFLALDLFLFYIFWEIVLVPMYLIIGIWGGADRIYATIKFVLYTLVGSLLMLVAILATAFSPQAATGSWTGAFDLLALRGTITDPTLQILGFAAFALAFFLIAKVAPFSVRKEIEEDQNTALGIVIGSVILGVAIIVAAAIQG
jgi:NADH-quinone oxidoreductase subunit M